MSFWIAILILKLQNIINMITKGIREQFGLRSKISFVLDRDVMIVEESVSIKNYEL